MAEGDQNGSVSGTVLGNSFSINGIKRISELIAILSLVVVAVMGVVLYNHSVEARENQRDIANELRLSREKQDAGDSKIQEAIKAQARATKMQTCLIYLSLPPEQKQKIDFETRRDMCK